jgi:hypothetical protein
VPEEKNPVDQVLDLVVFAPLGLALTARNQLPEMVAKGRAQVENQVTMARIIGQFAVQQGKVQVEKRLKAYATPASVPVPTRPPAAPEPDPAAPVAADPDALSDVVPEPPLEPGPSDTGPAPAAADLAIHGYDALSASQVVQRLAGLSPAELEQVRRYEAATRGRKTVLTKISQLQ